MVCKNINICGSAGGGISEFRILFLLSDPIFVLNSGCGK